MSKIQMLLDVVQDLNTLAEDLKAIADALERNEPVEEEAKKSEPVVAIEDLRAVLATKAVAEARKLLQGYEVRKLSELGKDQYREFLADAKLLPDKEDVNAT